MIFLTNSMFNPESSQIISINLSVESFNAIFAAEISAKAAAKAKAGADARWGKPAGNVVPLKRDD